MKKEIKKVSREITAWAIIPAFSDKALNVFPFLTKDRQYEIYLTRKAAEKANQGMDEAVVKVKITRET